MARSRPRRDRTKTAGRATQASAKTGVDRATGGRNRTRDQHTYPVHRRQHQLSECRVLPLYQAAAKDPIKLVEAEKAAERSDLGYLVNEVPRAIEQTLDGVAHVARIVKAMKEFAHPGSDEKTAVDLNRAIQNVVTVTRNEWKYLAEVS